LIMTISAVKERRQLGLRQSFRSLESPTYRAWFFSQVFSASGTMTQGVALSWLVLRLTGNGVDLGLMTACTFAPMMIFGPLTGSLVDRVDRRRLLIFTQTSLTLLAALLAVLIATGQVRVWMLFVITVVTGSVAAPDNTARQVYVIDLVGTERVASAVSLYEVIINTSRVVGPGTGGLILATLGVSACCAVNAASYVIPIAVLLANRTARSADSTARSADSTLPKAARDRTPGQLRAGLRYAWSNRPIRVSLFLAASSGMLFSLSVSLPVLATRVFHLGGGGYGMMMAVFGVGALPGALLASAGRGRPTGRSVGLLALATGAAVLATAAAPWLWLLIVGLIVTGCLSIWFIAQANTLVQLDADPAMRGRVMGLWTMALPGTDVASGPFVGYVTQDLGGREGFGTAGVALLLTASIGWRALTGHPGSAGSVTPE
jgi:MFS family permease